MHTAQSRTQMMLQEPVQTLIPRLAVPSIISMLITTIYNMADTYFVSQIGTSASGAVGVLFSAMAMVQALAFMMGIGAGNNISQCLGRGDEESAQRYASVGFFSAFGLGLVIMALGNLNLDAVVRFLGATETIAPYARDYARYIFFAAPFMMTSVPLNTFLRFSGLASYAVVGITAGGVLNILLDPLFIFVFDLGTAGAAIATAISQFVSFVILLLLSNTRPDAISISFKNFRPTLGMYRRIVTGGFPSLARQGIGSVSTVILNKMAGPYGDAAIAAMSIVMRYVMFLNSSIIGFGQGFQPVCGFSYGAGKYRRVRESLIFSVKVTTVALVILAIVSALFSGGIIAIFRRDDAQVIAIGTLALRLHLSTMPLWGVIIMCNMLTQTIGYSMQATLISISRQGIFLIPALLILPRQFGLNGLLISQPVADLFTFVVAFIVLRRVLADLERKQQAATQV